MRVPKRIGAKSAQFLGRWGVLRGIAALRQLEPRRSAAASRQSTAGENGEPVPVR
jgi:hypothetical protein